MQLFTNTSSKDLGYGVREKQSPRFENNTLYWYEFNTFDILFKFDPTMDGEPITPGVKDTISIAFSKSWKSSHVHTFIFEDVTEYSFALVMTEEITKKFTAGNYLMDVTYHGEHQTTIVNHYEVTVEPSLTSKPKLTANRTFDHGKLRNIDMPNQHSMDAITGLNGYVAETAATLADHDARLTINLNKLTALDNRISLGLANVTSEVEAARINRAGRKYDNLGQRIDAAEELAGTKMDITEATDIFNTKISYFVANSDLNRKAWQYDVDGITSRINTHDTQLADIAPRLATLEADLPSKALQEDYEALETTVSDDILENTLAHDTMRSEMQKAIDYCIDGINNVSSVIYRGTELHVTGTRAYEIEHGILEGNYYQNLDTQTLKAVENPIITSKGTSDTVYTHKYEVILRKVGDVSDTLDLVTGKVTKRIGEVVLNGSESWVFWDFDFGDIQRYQHRRSGVKYNGTSLNNRFTSLPTPTSENVWLQSNNPVINISILKSRLATQDVAGLKAWLQANPVKVYYELATPEEYYIEVPTLHSFKQDSHYTQTADTDVLATMELAIPSKLPDYIFTLATSLEHSASLLNAQERLEEQAQADTDYLLMITEDLL